MSLVKELVNTQRVKIWSNQTHESADHVIPVHS